LTNLLRATSIIDVATPPQAPNPINVVEGTETTGLIPDKDSDREAAVMNETIPETKDNDTQEASTPITESSNSPNSLEIAI